ncbi:hypothetical protein [Shewanella sp.]|uniref:hypothetical protein n=1 Tax=Shewanella sp. TaxID=50422 RepID=UPI003A83E172
MQHRTYCAVAPWIKVGLWSSGLLGLAILGFALASHSMTVFAAQGGSTKPVLMSKRPSLLRLWQWS